MAASNWLDDFLKYGSGGECPPKYIFWVGVTVIGSVLRRKVWIDQTNFQWTPNFYVFLVGPPGGPKKTTSINLGFNLLKHVPDLDLGPQIVTWQQLVTHMAEAKRKFVVDGEDFLASCVAIKIPELGTFLDTTNRELIDNLTNMWDANLDTIKKETRTMGSDEIVNPFLNIAAGTTPEWIEDNFSARLVGGGFASRPVYAYEERPPIDVAYPSRRKPSEHRAMRGALIERLCEFAELAGEFRLTDEAFEWGEQWYTAYRTRQRAMTAQEAGFYERQQAHLHKLAMVMCVARGGFPTITAEDLAAADEKLIELEPDVRTIFSKIGSTKISRAASTMVELLEKTGPLKKAILYQRFFFRTMSHEEFDMAFNSSVKAELIEMNGGLAVRKAAQ